ncbi:predicted protein, partial [Nematostella vectensis]
VFIGNTNQMSVARQTFKMPITTHAIRVLPVAYHGRAAMRLELYGCQTSSCNASVGMEYGYYLPSNIYSSSEEEKKVYGPSLARLSSAVGEAWTAMQNDAYQWLQVDFNSMQNVKYIATQGKVGTQERVKSYNLKHGNEQSTLKFIEENGKVKVFAGNMDENNISINFFNREIQTRHVKIIPISWYHRVSLRVDFYGCKHGE